MKLNKTQEEEFTKDKYDYINGVKGEKTITIETFFNLSDFNEGLKVLITDEGEYFNIYIIDSKFLVEPTNCLKLQEPKVDLKKFDKSFNPKKPKDYFNRMRLECYAIEHYLWSKYGNPDKNTTIDFNVSFQVEKFD